MPDEPIIFDFTPEDPNAAPPEAAARGEGAMANGPGPAPAPLPVPPGPPHAAGPASATAPGSTASYPFAMTSRFQADSLPLRAPASRGQRLAFGMLAALGALIAFAAIVALMRIADRSFHQG